MSIEDFDDDTEVTPVTGQITGPPSFKPPPWYNVALAEIGVKEVDGPGINERIRQYYAATQLGGKVTDDVVPWCSAFVNWVMRQANVRGTGSAMARSWLTWGTPLKTPLLGCVVVFSRPPVATSGHVSLYVGHQTNGDLIVLGGNQHNEVCKAVYPLSRLIGYRWPTATNFLAPVPPIPPPTPTK
jgi:uncharacterized protein (TIGR02594 family)